MQKDKKFLRLTISRNANGEEDGHFRTMFVGEEIVTTNFVDNLVDSTKIIY